MENKSLDAIVYDAVLKGGLIAERYGFPRIAGEIGALLFMTDGPLSLDEISQKLKVSKASVSTNVRLLESLRIVRRGDVRHGRRDFYEFAGDVWDVGGDLLRTTVQEEIQSLLRFSRDAQKRLGEIQRPGGAEAAASLAKIQKRVDSVTNLYELASNLVAALAAENKLSPGAVASLWKAAQQYRSLTKRK